MIPETPETPEIQFPETPAKPFRNSGIPLDTGILESPEIRTPSKPIRLALSENQTADVIHQAGGESHHGRAFAVVSPGSYPTAPGRLVLHVIECPSIAAASDACEVAQGLATIRRIKPRPTS